MLVSTMLLMSDDPALIELAGRTCRQLENLRLVVVPDFQALEKFESWATVALVLIHQSGPDLSIEIEGVLRKIAADRRPTPTLVLSDRYELDQALALLRLGLADYVESSIDPDRLVALVDVLTIRTRMIGRSSPGPKRPDSTMDSKWIENDSPPMTQMMDQVRRIASLDTTILLGGETGTGKSELARRIHALSDRKVEPYVVVNCGSLTTHRSESELFGDDRDHPGKFGEVGRGTLFLDEIDALPLALQARLLRVVEDRVFEPVGSNRKLPVEARLIAASNRVLEDEVQADRFRSDLYYRLNVIGFHLSPLRDRQGLIPILVDRLLVEFSHRTRSSIPTISPESLEVLKEYDWPGNLRELRNVIERSVTLAVGPEIRVEDLPRRIVSRNSWDPRSAMDEIPPSMATLSSRATLAQTKKDAELIRITEALEKHGHNRLRTAGELGISRMTLYKKLYKYGLIKPDGVRRNGFV